MSYAYVMDFEEQQYTVSITVLVTWADGLTLVDDIKGLNIGHALYLARLNWPDAESVSMISA